MAQPTDDSAIGTIETEIALLMRRAEATRRATPVAPHRALDRAAYVILRYLTDHGPGNVSAIADALSLDGSTVTRQVTALQRAGLVSRQPDPHDGRGTVVSPTGVGRTRVAAVRAARRDLYQQVLADWSAGDRSTLADLLHRLNVSIDAFVRR